MPVQCNSDIIEFPGSAGQEPMVRLCNFKTGKADLTTRHAAWLRQHLVPLIKTGNRHTIRLFGYASRLGGADFNMQLSRSRAVAVQKFLEEEVGQSLATVSIGAYGETRSSGAENDNSPVYRAVDVWVSVEKVTPPPTKPPDVSRLSTKMYFGVGVKFGGIVIAGTQSVEGYVFSADDYDDQAYLEARIWTAGLGLGGGANAVFILGYGAREKKDFVGLKFDGWDFAVSLGGRWGDALKAAKGLPVIARIAKVIKESDKAGKALKLASKLSPQEWERVSELVKASRDALGADPNATKPQLNVFDIPLVGAALEVSLYKWWGTVTAFN